MNRRIKRSAWFLSPIEPLDFTRLRHQWRFLPTAISRSYEALGLMADGTETESVRIILLRATRGAWAKWRDLFNSAKGQGFYGAIGELFHAGEPNIMRDFAAVGL